MAYSTGVPRTGIAFGVQASGEGEASAGGGGGTSMIPSFGAGGMGAGSMTGGGWDGLHLVLLVLVELAIVVGARRGFKKFHGG